MPQHLRYVWTDCFATASNPCSVPYSPIALSSVAWWIYLGNPPQIVNFLLSNSAAPICAWNLNFSNERWRSSNCFRFSVPFLFSSVKSCIYCRRPKFLCFSRPSFECDCCTLLSRPIILLSRIINFYLSRSTWDVCVRSRFFQADFMCLTKLLCSPDHLLRRIRDYPSRQLRPDTCIIISIPLVSFVRNGFFVCLRGLPPIAITKKLMRILCNIFLFFGLWCWCWCRLVKSAWPIQTSTWATICHLHYSTTFASTEWHTTLQST